MSHGCYSQQKVAEIGFGNVHLGCKECVTCNAAQYMVCVCNSDMCNDDVARLTSALATIDVVSLPNIVLSLILCKMFQ